MDNTVTQRFKDILSQHDRVGIMVGKNPTVDDMAAALALYLSLKAANKSVTIASASQPLVEHSSLVGINEVKSALGGSATGDLVVSFPYQEGEIEKVSYTIENSFLNIVVKAGQNGLAFTEQDVRFTRGAAGGLPTLLIAVGTAQLALLGDLFNPEMLKDTSIINIDNKPENQGFGDLVIVAPEYSSVSELMANVILTNGLPLDVDAAQNLLNGISFATNNFQNPQTSFYAFEIVAELMRRGAVRMPVRTSQAPMPSFMQQPRSAQPQPQQPQQSASMPRSQGMQRSQNTQGRGQFGQQQQQRGNQQQTPQQQQQSRMTQRFNQNQQQRQNNRQDEIRRALAEQARSMHQPQQMNQPAQNAQPMPQPQPQQQPQQQQGTQEAPSSEEAPSDWLTPKVYKGSTNIS